MEDDIDDAPCGCGRIVTKSQYLEEVHRRNKTLIENLKKLVGKITVRSNKKTASSTHFNLIKETAEQLETYVRDCIEKPAIAESLGEKIEYGVGPDGEPYWENVTNRKRESMPAPKDMYC